METKKTKQQRKDLRHRLEFLICSAKSINTIMDEVPHQRNVAYRSLKNKSGQFIIHTSKGFTSTYQGEDGKLYDIKITEKN